MDTDPLEKSVCWVGQRIKQRTEIRQQLAEERKATLQDKASEIESKDKFYASFAKRKEFISGCLNDESDMNKDVIESIRNDINVLQQFLNEASMYLPSFQLKKSQETIDALTTNHTNIQNKMFPKKKFGFKKKKKVNTIVNVPTEIVVSSTSDTNIAALAESNFFGFRNHRNSTLTKSATELENKQLNLQNLVNCQIHALGNPQSLQIANLADCTVHIGPTTRSAFIKMCKGCTFHVACQQLRIHCTTDSRFFLHVTGSAIIEDCTMVTFSPYNLTYDGIDEHYVESGLSRHVNNWDKIEDFHWLNENENSPNFSLVNI